MEFVSYFFIYCLVWWIVLFIVLSIGIEVESSHGAGHERGAPKNPHMWKRILITTVASLPVTILIKLILKLFF